MPPPEDLKMPEEWADDDTTLDRDPGAALQPDLPKIVVIGRTGEGKSSLLNNLVGGAHKVPPPFVTSQGAAAGTNEVTTKIRRFRGPHNLGCEPGAIPPKLVVVDVPGFSDPEGRDTPIMQKLVRECRRLRSVSVFVVVMNAGDPRLSGAKKNMFKHLVSSCGTEALRNCLVVFTHWAHTKKAKRLRRRAGGPALAGRPVDEAEQQLQDDKRNELSAFCRAELSMGDQFQVDCVFVNNMFSMEDLQEPDLEDGERRDIINEGHELARQYGVMRRKIFERACPVDPSQFEATRSLEDQLRHEREEERQRVERERQRAQAEQQRRTQAEQRAREQQQQAQRAQQQMRQAEQRAADERRQREEAARRLQALNQFVGVFVKFGSRTMSFPLQERVLRKNDTVAKVKTLLRERGHMSGDVLKEISLMYGPTALAPARTLESYGMAGAGEYELIAIAERPGGMNRAMRRFLQQAPTKDINGMGGVPTIRQCPSCKQLIRHVDRCKHMTCHCGHQFCFACMRTWGACGSSGSGKPACHVARRQG